MHEKNYGIGPPMALNLNNYFCDFIDALIGCDAGVTDSDQAADAA